MTALLKDILEVQNTYILGKTNSNVKKVDKKLKAFLILLYLTELKSNLEGSPENNNLKITNLVTKFFRKFKYQDDTDDIFLEISQFIRTNNFEFIIWDLLDRLDSELAHNIRSASSCQSFNSSYYNDEEKQKKNFVEANKNGSIVQKLFYIPQEQKIKCKCKNITYNYFFEKFLLVDLNKETNEILLKDKIFTSKKMNKKESCNFCPQNNSKEVEEFFFDFPKILIVYLKGEKIHKFSLSSNFDVKDSIKNASYSLASFIELNTNLVYFKLRNNWYYYNENYLLDKANIERKKPIILVYRLKNNDNSFINNDIKSNNPNNKDLKKKV